jgi:Insect cuticle protein
LKEFNDLFKVLCFFLASVATVLAAPVPEGPGPHRGPLIGGPGPLIGGPGLGGPGPIIAGARQGHIVGPRPFGPGPLRGGPLIGGPGPLLRGPGLIGGGPIGPGHIGAGPIGAGHLGAGPLGARPIGAGHLGAGPLGAGPIGAGPIGAGPIGAGHLGAGPIGAGPLGAGPLGAGPLGAGHLGAGPIGPGPIHPPVPVYGEPAYDGPAVYSFTYGVQDDYAGLNFGHSENRDGYKTEGTYYVNLPDGRLQTVNYHADEAGYIADVQYTGAPVVPAYAPAPIVRPAYVP